MSVSGTYGNWGLFVRLLFIYLGWLITWPNSCENWILRVFSETNSRNMSFIYAKSFYVAEKYDSDLIIN